MTYHASKVDPMRKAQFRGPVLAGHKQAAVEVPLDPAKQWGIVAALIPPGRRGFGAKGTFAGVPFQGLVVPRSKGGYNR